MLRHLLGLMLFIVCAISCGCGGTAGSGKFKDEDKPRAADHDK